MTLAWPNVFMAWEQLEVPEGWRLAQVTREHILILPLGDGLHGHLAAALNRQLVLAEECAAYQVGQGFAGSLRDVGIYLPDLFVMNESKLRDKKFSIPLRNFVLIVEITTPGSAVNDRTKKWRAYAKGEVAQYLLVDPYDPGGPTVTLYSAPVGGVYRESARISFGEKIRLLEPVPVLLDTQEFLVAGPQ